MNTARIGYLANQLSLVCIHDIHFGSVRDKKSSTVWVLPSPIVARPPEPPPEWQR